MQRSSGRTERQLCRAESRIVEKTQYLRKRSGNFLWLKRMAEWISMTQHVEQEAPPTNLREYHWVIRTASDYFNNIYSGIHCT